MGIKMSCVFLSEKANKTIKIYLDKIANVIEIKETCCVYEAVASHADIYLCAIEDELIIAREQLPFIEDKLIQKGIPYQAGSSLLGYRYPANVKYNGVYIGNYFIHNLNDTDPLLLKKAKDNSCITIDVKQGYTKCNMVVVDHRSVITSDRGIEKQLRKYGLSVLLIDQGSVLLKGFEYGFLGGASGRVGNTILFNGNLESHPNYVKIKQFIEDRGLQVEYFKDYPLEDIGSIIEVRGQV